MPVPSLADAERFQMLYREHHGWLQQWLRGRIGSSVDAADLAQDTFLRVLGKPRALDEVREPRAWLSRIAHGLVVDKVRRDEVERACLQAIAALPQPEAISPEARMLLIELLAAIDAVLEGLGARAREAFLLSRLEQMSYSEIAARMGVSLSSVEKYMAAAIRHCYLMRQSLRD
ncbi:sigma-70 family RNA polymerase sigma factor [Herbaspirillum sp. AP02]|uniref:sigma-70 family RNA polymerase sigma factor n=1 Tax=unclassified Herbaspirillum TaxID=2624150 RepID=UPI0018C8DDB7|nr:sigma-70 family RNA polymerase sigma factor [Herbaspirillum sp. AP02]MBG7618030.1 sigma-70 family RNA polymerase sigma factor [Herbaspirillum sp. AP02]